MARFEITLDMVLETRQHYNRTCVQGQVHKDLKKYSLQSTVLEEVGPAGCAVVRLFGAHAQLACYLSEVYCAGDPLEAKFFTELIKPYEGAADWVPA